MRSHHRTPALWGLAFGAAALGAVLGGCNDEPPDGYTSVTTGDTYGEWELIAEYDDGEWTGCLRLEPVPGEEQCSDPTTELVQYEDEQGLIFGAVAEGSTLVFADGDEVDLVDGQFFVVGEDAEVELAD
jgi:hypothetical protein